MLLPGGMEPTNQLPRSTVGYLFLCFCTKFSKGGGNTKNTKFKQNLCSTGTGKYVYLPVLTVTYRYRYVPGSTVPVDGDGAKASGGEADAVGRDEAGGTQRLSCLQLTYESRELVIAASM